MAAAFVNGLQGNDSRFWLTASILKHFMANSNEDDRGSSSSDFDDALMREYYAAPFRTAIQQGGANALMVSYNAVNHIPMTANPLLETLVMKQWGFDGLIDTDRSAVSGLVTSHKYFPDMDHAVAGTIHIGVNQFLNSYQDGIQGALKKGLITEADIDENLRGVFRVLIRLGLLDSSASNPYAKIGTRAAEIPWKTQTVNDLVLRATRESIVLLKNSPEEKSAPLLPLDASRLKSIAVIGPRADEVDSDGYGGTPPFAITPLEGIRNKVGDRVAVRYSASHDDAVELAKTSDVVIVFIGNQPVCDAPPGHCADPTEGKEAVDRKLISLNPEQEKLMQDVYAANPRTVVVLVSGFPYTINWAEQHVPAIVHLAHSSEVEGTAIADVLFGDYNPAGRLVMTWPQSIDQLPPMMDYNIRDGRTYMYFKEKPLYPFGYGLSYTHFRYSGMRISSSKLHQGDEMIVSIHVTNAGTRAGDEVVQLYLRHMDSKVQRPLKELKGFERVALGVKETKTVEFHLPAKSLAFWDETNNRWEIEHDRVRLMIGSSSADIKARKILTITH
jgi:beta-glucosidase